MPSPPPLIGRDGHWPWERRAVLSLLVSTSRMTQGGAILSTLHTAQDGVILSSRTATPQKAHTRTLSSPPVLKWPPTTLRTTHVLYWRVPHL